MAVPSSHWYAYKQCVVMAQYKGKPFDDSVRWATLQRAATAPGADSYVAPGNVPELAAVGPAMPCTECPWMPLARGKGVGWGFSLHPGDGPRLPVDTKWTAAYYLIARLAHVKTKVW